MITQSRDRIFEFIDYARIVITSRAVTAVTITMALAQRRIAPVPGKQPPVYFCEQTLREAALERVQATRSQVFMIMDEP